MSMKTGKAGIFFSSTAGIIAMAVILIVINFLVGQSHIRVDLTEDKLYTLSEGSRQIVSRLNTPVTIRFYSTRQSNEMPIMLKSYAKRVEDLLMEYKLVSNGKIHIQKFDPEPDSDAEDAASLDGIEGQLFPSGDKIYLGIAVNCLDKTESLPFLSPDTESTLEYDVTQLIYRVSNAKDDVIGIMSTLSVMGITPPPPLRPGIPPQVQAKPAWTFVSELKKDYDVRQVAMTVETIPEDISTLIVVHPKDISDKAQYAIDQFVVGGGHLIAFVDPLSAIDQQKTPENPLSLDVSASSLDKLFNAWGIEFDKSKVVMDMRYATELGRGQSDRQRNPVVLTLDNNTMNSKEIVTNALDRIIFAYSGVFKGEPVEGLSATTLITTSKQSQLVASFRTSLSPDSLAKDFVADDIEYALAIRLTGTFKTAFPDGPPGGSTAAESADDGNETQDEESTSSPEGAVIIISDSDMLYDDFWVQKVNFFGRTMLQVFGDNNNFLQNCVEQLSGDNSLISIRSRGVTNRPFLVVRDLQLEAEKRYKSAISSLEEKLQEAQRKVSELARTKKDQKQRYVLSAEQKRELEKFRQTQVEVRKELKETRKDLRRDIDQLETQLKWINIALMPFLVSCSGLTLAMIRRRKMRQS